ncbi:MAG: Panacea domain-containing protein [archaeon]
MAQTNLAKLEEMTHYIISKCDSKNTFGKTVLFKLLYFSDFNHYKTHFEAISNEEYRKIEHGPAPKHFNLVLERLAKGGKVEYKENKKQKEPWVFKSKVEPQIKYLNNDELKTIDRVIKKLGHLNATEISSLSHSDNPYKATKLKEIISYGLVFYRPEDIERQVEG